MKLNRPTSWPYRAWTRSLRFRLTAWFTGTLALLLLLLATLLFLGAQHTLRGETDAFLMSEAQHITSLDAGDSEEATDASDLVGAVASYRLAPPGQHPFHHPNSLLLFDTVYIRLLKATDKKPIATSPSLVGQTVLITALDKLTPRSRPSPPHFSFVAPNEEQAMRVLTETTQVGQRMMVLQVAVPWDHNADVLERLELLLAVTLPAVLLAAAVGGWALVGRTLRPIQRIVTEAKKLDVNALPKELLPPPGETDSEIGNLVATLNTMTTRLHQAFEAQRRFAEAQQQFAADASHELRTPLTILRGEMELAITRPRSAEAYIGTIISGIEEITRMSRIVEGLSFLARHDASQIESSYSHATVDIALLTRKVIEDFERQAGERQIALRYTTEAYPALVQGNEAQLQQLISNLVDNAMKYTPCGGSVSVSVAENGDEDGDDRQYALTVEDTGMGIEEQDLPFIFQRFWQADQARTSGGSGLGLAICAQIVQLHYGRISVGSRPGCWTRVQVALPSSTQNSDQDRFF